MADFATLKWNTLQPRSQIGHKFCQHKDIYAHNATYQVPSDLDENMRNDVRTEKHFGPILRGSDDLKGHLSCNVNSEAQL